MKHKIRPILLLCLILSFALVTAAAASDGGSPQASADSVAKLEINGVTEYFDSAVGVSEAQAMRNAWNAAQGKTAVLTLLKSVDLTTDGGNEQFLVSSSATDLTIDMADEVTLSSSAGYIVRMERGKLTLRSGEIINRLTGNNTYVFSVIDATLTIGENAKVTGGYYGVYAIGGTVNVAGVISAGDSGVNVYPSSSGSCVLNMTGGAVSGGTNGIWALMNSVVNISGGQVRGGTRGLYVNGAEVELSGGEFSSILYLSSKGTVGDLLKEDYAYKTSSDWINNVQVSELKGPVFVRKIPVKITDPISETVNVGTSVELFVTATPSDPDAHVIYQWYQKDEMFEQAIPGETKAKMVLPSMDVEGEFTYFCDVTCDGYVVRSGEATITVGSYAAYVDVGGEQSSYKTLKEAWDATAGEGKSARIILLGNSDLGSGTAGQLKMEKDCEITLVGGRYKVTTKSTRLFKISAGTLNIESGSYEIVSTVSGGYCAEVGGTLNLKGGSLQSLGSGGRGLYVNKGKVNITGGSVSGTSYGIYATASGSKLTISDGVIYGKSKCLQTAKGITTLSGGEFQSPGTSLYNDRDTLGALLAADRAFYQKNGGWLYKLSAAALLYDVKVLPIPVQINSVTGETVIYQYDHYEGQTLVVDATPLDPAKEITYQWYLNGNPIDGATAASYKVPNDLPMLKYQYACQITCDEYVCMADTVVITVVEEDFVCNAPTASAVYGQTLREVEIVNPEGNTRGTWQWDDPDAEVGAVGTQVHKAIFYPTRDDVFDPVPNVEVSVTVRKSAPELKFAVDYDPSTTYSGHPLVTPTRRYVTIGGVSEGTLQFTWYHDSLAPENKLSAPPTNAGTYVLQAELLETENSGYASDHITVVISPRAFEPTILCTPSMPYSGTAQVPSVVVRDGSVLVPSSEYSLDVTNNVDVGTATVTVVDNEGGNYIVSGSTTFQITPRALTIRAVLAQNKEYDGLSDVKIVSVALDNVAEDANSTPDDVRVDFSQGIIAELVLAANLHPNCGSYDRVLLPELQLTGEKAGNYLLVQQPSQSVRLFNPVQITKTTLPVNSMTAKKRISTRYSYEYQWSMAEMRPEIHEPMVYADPQCVLSSVDINPLYYNASTAQVSLSGEHNSVIKVPITLAPSVTAPDAEVLIGKVKVTMTFRNYNDVSYELEIYAGNWITAEIIGIEECAPVNYDGNSHLGYINTLGETLGNYNAKTTGDDEGKPIEGNVAYRVFYSGTGDTVYNSPPTQPPVNAGTYLVTIEIAEHECNYIGIGYYSFTINKLPATFTAPTAKTNLVYDRSIKALVNEGSSKDGTMLYALREEGMTDEQLAFSKAVPTATQAGTYTVCYKVAGNANHLDSEIHELTVTIAKAQLDDFTLSGRSGLVYNGREQALVIATNSVRYGTLEYSLDGEEYSVNVPTVKDAGTYTVYYKLVSSNDNYSDSAPKTVDVTIEKRALRIISSAAHNRPYDGGIRVDIMSITVFPIETGDDVSVDVTGLQADLVLAEGGHPNAGEYGLANLLNKSDLELIGKDAKNYSLIQPTGPVQLYARLQLTKAQLPTDFEKTKEVCNYLGTTYRWSALDFNPADITESISQFNVPTLTLEDVYFYLDAYNDEGAWIENNELVVPIKSVNASVEEVIAAITLRLDYDNYESTQCVVRLRSINKTISSVTGVSSAGQVPYTGSGVVGYTGTPVSGHVGEYTVSYTGTGSTVYPHTTEPPVELGTYRVTIAIPETDPTYLGETSLEFSIVKADPVVTGLSANSDLRYNGDPLALVTAGSVNGGTLVYALQIEDEELIYSEEIPTAVETGTYVVWYKVLGDDHYNDLAAKSIEAEITTARRNPSSGTISVPTTTGNGVASATVTDAMSQTLVRQAENSNNGSIVIATDVGTTVSEVSVELQAPAVKTIAERSDLPVTITTPVADVTLSAAGMEQLAAGAQGATVTVQQTEDGVALSIDAGGQTLSEIDGGVMLAIPCGAAGAGTVAMLVDENGERSVVRKSVVVDGKLYVSVDGSATVILAENAQSFDDISEDHWAEEAIDFVSSHELMTGVGKANFNANATMTRGMLAQVLYNLENAPENDEKALFTDVESGVWYEEAVDWAASEGIIKGYGKDLFGPEDPITRQQLAAMLYRYMGSPEPGDVELEFQDADEISSYAEPAMRWAVQIGLFAGRRNNILAPGDTATRAEVAMVILRLCKYIAGVK